MSVPATPSDEIIIRKPDMQNNFKTVTVQTSDLLIWEMLIVHPVCVFARGIAH